MRISHKTILYLLFILLVPTTSVLPHPTTNIRIKSHNNKNYISLYDFINKFDVYNSFDIISGRGKLLHKGSFAVYQIGFSVILINGVLTKSEYPVITDKGEILFPVEFLVDIVKHFYPNRTIKRRGYVYYLEDKDRILKKKLDPNIVGGDKGLREVSDRDRISFIIIDPGHGGKDPGAVGRGGLKEKGITLRVSKHLERYLRKKLKGIKIILTRKSDRFIKLEERTKIANRMLKFNENGIFLSIHVNASISKSVSGFETYFLSQNPSNEEARTTAALENNVVILEEKSTRDFYGDIDHIEALMITTQIQKESSMLAYCVQKEMDKRIWESKSKGVKKADFFVLRGVLMPAIIIEIGFISNRNEAKNLGKSSYQKKIAEGIGDGILLFIKKYNKKLKK